MNFQHSKVFVLHVKEGSGSILYMTYLRVCQVRSILKRVWITSSSLIRLIKFKHLSVGRFTSSINGHHSLYYWFDTILFMSFLRNFQLRWKDLFELSADRLAPERARWAYRVPVSSAPKINCQIPRVRSNKTNEKYTKNRWKSAKKNASRPVQPSEYDRIIWSYVPIVVIRSCLFFRCSGAIVRYYRTYPYIYIYIYDIV